MQLKNFHDNDRYFFFSLSFSGNCIIVTGENFIIPSRIDGALKYRFITGNDRRVFSCANENASYVSDGARKETINFEEIRRINIVRLGEAFRRRRWSIDGTAGGPSIPNCYT